LGQPKGWKKLAGIFFIDQNQCQRDNRLTAISLAGVILGGCSFLILLVNGGGQFDSSGKKYW
jgi:hypothetical protein